MICSPSELGPIIRYSIYLWLFCSPHVERLNLPQYLRSFLLPYLPIQSICHNDLTLTFFDLDVHRWSQSCTERFASGCFKHPYLCLQRIQGASRHGSQSTRSLSNCIQQVLYGVCYILTKNSPNHSKPDEYMIPVKCKHINKLPVFLFHGLEKNIGTYIQGNWEHQQKYYIV